MLHDFSKDVFDIIIVAGQSNSEGCGIGPLEHPFIQSPEILMMENDYIIVARSGHGEPEKLKNEFTILTAGEKVRGNDIVGNFGLSFAEKYLYNGKLQSDRKLLLLMAGVGGTSFYAKRWGLEDDLFLRMMEMLKTAMALNKENRLVALLWHQGESDTQNPDRDVHYKNLTNLVKEVREVSEQDNLPFIAGDFVKNWYNENEEICKPIVTAIKDVCNDIGHSAFIETEGLQSNHEKVGDDDMIHFSREALYFLGHRYFNAFEDIINLH